MKNLLVVVDMQNDFIDGSLGFKNAKDIIPNIIKKLEFYNKNQNDIIFTLDTHTNNYQDSIEGKILQIKHCIKDTFGHKIHKDLEAFAKNHLMIQKSTFGSFELGEIIKYKNYNSIELCGLVSDICVISNAIIVKSASPNSKIFIDAKAVSSSNLYMQKIAFELMKNLHIDIFNLD
ncbi:cysteine hydrolase [Campylobacter sp. FMV-PI01]|uniref:nicotinamidase n=1 Tax=Campylobacter portucalensis TaxID=2608384 RepID=A0A6L5WKC5_9BACT|nr:isochorismatase family cysteine hydrolase [Campylobacter portucalensis]MSN96313.1 cysteine hydrolase [Campylobacter portucalensis]